MADLTNGKRIPPGYVYDQINGIIPAPPAKKPFNTGKNITEVLGDLWDASKLQGMAPEFTEMGSLPNVSVISGNAVKGLGLLGDEIKNSRALANIGQSAEDYLSNIGGLLHAVEPGDIPKRLGRQVQAPKQVDVPNRFISGSKAGTYRGTEAFGGITPQKLGNMRINYLDAMDKGVNGRLWYDLSSKDINRWTGGDEAKADLMANMLATTSSRTPVSSNLMYANKGWNQNLAGDPIITGGFPNVMGAKIQEAINHPDTIELGLKRSPFSAGLSVDWKGADFANRATHDIHDARAWGIVDPKTGELWDKGINDSGHRFLDEQSAYVTKKALEKSLGGVDDWTPYRAQAAAWITQKAKTDGTTIAEAARHYGSFSPEYQALINREWITGDNTGHLPELHSAPWDVKQAYSDAMEKNMLGPQGVDRLASSVGALTDTSYPNLGLYEGVKNPAFTSRINVGKAPGAQVIDPASEKVMDAITATHGLLGTQKQSAYNYAGGSDAIKRSEVIRLAGDHLDDAKLSALSEDLQKLGVEAPMRDPAGGARFLHFVDEDALKNQGMNAAEIAKEVERQKTALSKALKPLAANHGLTPEHLTRSGNIFPWAPTEQWSAKPYLDVIDQSGKMSEHIDKAIRPIAEDLLNTTNELAQKNGWTQAKWYKPMMEGLRDGGLARLKELVAQGIVPVTVLSVIGANQLPQKQGQAGLL